MYPALQDFKSIFLIEALFLNYLVSEPQVPYLYNGIVIVCFKRFLRGAGKGCLTHNENSRNNIFTGEFLCYFPNVTSFIFSHQTGGSLGVRTLTTEPRTYSSVPEI